MYLFQKGYSKAAQDGSVGGGGAGGDHGDPGVPRVSRQDTALTVHSTAVRFILYLESLAKFGRIQRLHLYIIFVRYFGIVERFIEF